MYCLIRLFMDCFSQPGPGRASTPPHTHLLSDMFLPNCSSVSPLRIHSPFVSETIFAPTNCGTSALTPVSSIASASCLRPFLLFARHHQHLSYHMCPQTARLYSDSVRLAWWATRSLFSHLVLSYLYNKKFNYFNYLDLSADGELRCKTLI